MKRRGICCVLVAAAVTCGPAFGRDYQCFDVVGDSISAGVNPECGLYGWVDMLFGESGCGRPAKTNTLFSLWPGITNYNSAVSGSTAKQWAWQQPSYLAAVSNHHPDLVIVFIGGNDGIAYAADGVYTDAEREEFRTNLITIVTKLRNNDPVPEIVVADYYDLFDGCSSNLPAPFAAYRAMSAAVAQGNQLIRGVAESNACFFADIYPAFMHHGYGEDLGDTNHLDPDYVRTPLSAFDIHPVTAGHEMIYDLMYQVLAELKEIPRFVGSCYAADLFVVRWRSGVNQQYVIERSTDLVSGFTAIATNAATPTVNVFTDVVENLERGFYRVQTQ